MPATKKNLRRGPKEGKKGSRSKTAHGRKNYTTKRTSKVFHRKGHYVRPGYKPFGSRKGSHSRTHKGKINYIRGGAPGVIIPGMKFVNRPGTITGAKSGGAPYAPTAMSGGMYLAATSPYAATSPAAVYNMR